MIAFSSPSTLRHHCIFYEIFPCEGCCNDGAVASELTSGNLRYPVHSRSKLNRSSDQIFYGRLGPPLPY